MLLICFQRRQWGITIAFYTVGEQAIEVLCLVLLCIGSRGAQPPILLHQARPSEDIGAKVCVAPSHPANTILFIAHLITCLTTWLQDASGLEADVQWQRRTCLICMPAVRQSAEIVSTEERSCVDSGYRNQTQWHQPLAGRS